MDSFRTAQNFANDQDLLIVQSENSEINNSKELMRNEYITNSITDIEATRVREANKIRTIDSQIKKIRYI